MYLIKAVEIVEITKKTPIFKAGEMANAIESINFRYNDGSNCGYNLIAQKDLYEIGDLAIYIQPDYCLPEDIELFDGFIKPNGDPKKSRLGKHGRIRAVKFNFNFENSTEPIYSFGILLPMDKATPYITNPNDLQESLKITKYEEPETQGSGLVAGAFPGFMYKTDETNFNNAIDKVIEVIAEGEEFGVSWKKDGSSWTQYTRKAAEGWKQGICSRNQEKSLDQTFVELYKDVDGKEYHRYTLKETGEKGWINDEDMVFIKDKWAKENLTPITVEVRDSWVDLAKEGGYLEKTLKYCQEHDVQLVLRGELCGSGLKGSGNRFNPDSKNKPSIMLFGVDSLETGFSVRNHYGDVHNLEKVATELDLPYIVPEWIKPSSIEELIKFCEDIFKREEAEGRIIEGVVIRSKYSNKISLKFMNAKYDAVK